MESPNHPAPPVPGIARLPDNAYATASEQSLTDARERLADGRSLQRAAMAKEQEPSPVEAIARHRVRDRLESMILAGKSKPGSKLPQQRLARRFGVSQSVVREALFELRSVGLVESVDNRGMYVARLDARTLLESYDIRALHEGLVARLCCDTVTRAELRELQRTAEQIHALAEQGKFEEAGKLDRSLHDRLVHLSGHSMLIRLSEQYRVLSKVVQTEYDPAAVREQHMEVLEAIGAGKPDDAERRMRQHILVGKHYIEEQIQKGQFVPHWLA
ncbi:MAG TPA: GntR family transcriptional regulator [Tepidisphaeraceae bacterium]|jgi:DNA-binding GntR family transcriptional regulator